MKLQTTLKIEYSLNIEKIKRSTEKIKIEEMKN